ncbi:hypothetical protein EYF80_026052 [Liparis tanakae]|uniref:Uncharacterized protein n=1 Tax=Liparis tanakae TaxID=230148 RepID=A0A4Z2HEL8_9TELE|nr:hypothetical protein EYF80_026052 [Liparis tanakae]
MERINDEAKRRFSPVSTRTPAQFISAQHCRFCSGLSNDATAMKNAAGKQTLVAQVRQHDVTAQR